MRDCRRRIAESDKTQSDYDRRMVEFWLDLRRNPTSMGINEFVEIIHLKNIHHGCDLEKLMGHVYTFEELMGFDQSVMDKIIDALGPWGDVVVPKELPISSRQSWSFPSGIKTWCCLMTIDFTCS